MSSTILLLGSDLRVRELLRLQLADRGHRVFEAGSAIAGSVAARICIPDVIVVDGLLPDSDGLGWVKVQRDGGKAPHIVLVSESLDAAYLQTTTRSLGVELVARRPIEAGALATQIESVLPTATTSSSRCARAASATPTLPPASSPPPIPADALQTRLLAKAPRLAAPESPLAMGTVPFALRSFGESDEDSSNAPALDEATVLGACPIVDFSCSALRGLGRS